MAVSRACVAVLAACGSGKPAAPPPQQPAVSHEAGSAAGDAAPPPAAGGRGDLQIRVEWHDVPLAARASPGRTPCGTARMPAVAPTTTWGIPDAFVVVAVDGVAPPAAHDVRVTYERCALAPRAVVAGTEVIVGTSALGPAGVTIARRAALPDLAAPLADAARTIALPIAGHEVTVALEIGGAYELAAADETAWILAAGSPFVAVTDAAGVATLRDVPSGRHAVTAWLPPRAGQPARLARGEADVTAGALADVTLDIGKP